MTTNVTSITKSLDRIADALEEQSGGSSGGAEPLIIHETGELTDDYLFLDITWKDLKDAFVSGRTCIKPHEYDDGNGTINLRYMSVVEIAYNSSYGDHAYTVMFSGGDYFYAGNENEYPKMSIGGD